MSHQQEPDDGGGRFALTEVGCAAGCIRLASVDLLTGNVRRLPETISNLPIEMLQLVRDRRDSRLVIVFGQPNECGSGRLFHYLLAVAGCRFIGDDQIRRTPRPIP